MKASTDASRLRRLHFPRACGALHRHLVTDAHHLLSVNQRHIRLLRAHQGAGGALDEVGKILLYIVEEGSAFSHLPVGLES